MRNQIATRSLPALLALFGIAVILILSRAGKVRLPFGLVVAGTAGILLVSMMRYEVANSNEHDPPCEHRSYRQVD
jgi:hypothetical protein